MDEVDGEADRVLRALGLYLAFFLFFFFLTFILGRSLKWSDIVATKNSNHLMNA